MILDALATDDAEVRVRAKLEEGRVFNSRGNAGDADRARRCFSEAFTAATNAGFDFLAVDALHMLAIVAPAEEQDELNMRALDLASSSADLRARQWRASLLNNLGWTRFNAGELDAALALFEEAVEERVRMGKEREIGFARWCVARTFRAMDRPSEALEAQEELAAWLAARSMSDSFVEQEIGECLVALGRGHEAAEHFGAAAELLDAAGPGETPDAERLGRLRTLEKDHARPG